MSSYKSDGEDKNNVNTLGNELKRARKHAGISSSVEAAKRMNVSHGTIERWEQGITLPSNEKLLKLAKTYGRDVEEIKKRYIEFLTAAGREISDIPEFNKDDIKIVKDQQLPSNEDNLSKELKIARMRAGIRSQADAAKMLNVGYISLIRWETGINLPSNENLWEIAKAYGKNSEEIKQFYIKFMTAAGREILEINSNDIKTVKDKLLNNENSLSDELMEARLSAGIHSQSKIAKMVNVTAFTVGRWETGVNIPTSENLWKLAKAYGRVGEESKQLYIKFMILAGREIPEINSDDIKLVKEKLPKPETISLNKDNTKHNLETESLGIDNKKYNSEPKSLVKDNEDCLYILGQRIPLGNLSFAAKTSLLAACTLASSQSGNKQKLTTDDDLFLRLLNNLMSNYLKQRPEKEV